LGGNNRTHEESGICKKEPRGDEIGSSRIGFRMRWRLLSTTGSVLSKEFGTMNLRWGVRIRWNNCRLEMVLNGKREDFL
jgi:hypothetical protein